jgi:phosphomannomutase
MSTDPKTVVKFGTDGWRGVIADTFTFANVRIVVQAIADYIKQKTGKPEGIVIGYDNRFQGEHFAQITAEVMTGNGIPVFPSDRPFPTPLISFAVKQYGFDGGIMITASHNPPEYSGIKFKMPEACSADPETTRQFEELICTSPVRGRDLADAEANGMVQHIELEYPYLEWIRNFIDYKIINQKPYTIIVDSMHGVGKRYIENLLTDTCHTVITIRSDRNPAFGGIAPEPVPKNMAATAAALKEHNADVAFVTDGDADRLAALDSNGEYIITPKIATLMAMHLLKNRHWTGSMIKTISCSVIVDRFAQEHGLTLEEKPVGFKYIVPYLLNNEALIGTEESGGLGIKNHIPERDGILGALIFLEALVGLGFNNSAEAMAYIDSHYGTMRYHRIDCEIEPAQKETFLKSVEAAPPQELLGKKVVNIKDFDGVKFECADDSWLLLRFSGTEPVVRFYAEAPSMEEAEALTAFGLNMLKG